MAVLKKHRPPISSFEQGEITEPFLGASFLEPAFIAAWFSFLWVKRQTLCFATKGGFRPHGPRIQVLFYGVEIGISLDMELPFTPNPAYTKTTVQLPCSATTLHVRLLKPRNAGTL